MLVLSRYVNQSLYIGDDIKVKILRVHGGQVRIGIEAPKQVAIVREELHDERKPEDDGTLA